MTSEGDWFEKSLPSVEDIQQRLRLIFPPELDPRGWATRKMAARTVFVMLYGYAIEGFETWMRPTAVTDMTNEQAAKRESGERRSWLALVQSFKRPKEVPGRWYQENSREPIRDETLRKLTELNAVIERTGLPTTSSKPRYALARDFADLFSPQLVGVELEDAVAEWREKHLSAAARARLALSRRGAGAQNENVLVAMPSGETRRLAPGPSSILSKAVVELFASRFLSNPAVILLSESARKMVHKDEELAHAIGLNIEISGALPDVILVDLDAEPPLLVFIECVVTDGAVTERRKQDLERLALAGGFQPSGCAFVTAFRDRSDSPFSKMASSLAWDSFAWFATEPDSLLYLRLGTEEPVTLESLRKPPAVDRR
jgi:hypothetical protein